MENPCKKDCPDRNSTCHGSCPRYKEFKEFLAKEKEAIEKRKQTDCNFYGYQRDTLMKIKRNSHGTSKVLKNKKR